MKSRIRRRLGRRFRHWGEIPPPELPEAILQLEPRLRHVSENAVLRLVTFRTALAEGWGVSPLGIPPQLRMIATVFAIWVAVGVGFVTLGPWLAASAARLNAVMGIVGFVALVALPAWMAFGILNPAGWDGGIKGGIDPAVILGDIFSDLRPVPLSAEDFAVAQWGGMMLKHKLWRDHPAWALHLCCSSVRSRCERLSGWTYYPSTVKVCISDGFSKGTILFAQGGINQRGVPMTPHGELLYPPLGDQWKVARDVFDYSTRFDFLIGLWREYLDIYRPDDTEEGKARRAMPPGAYHDRIDAIIEETNRRRAAGVGDN